MSRKSKTYTSMCPRQYNEMLDFYEKLGYSTKQCQALSERCFGADIIVEEDAYYNEDWSFYRNYRSPSPPSGGFMGMAQSFFSGRMKKSAPACGMPMVEAEPLEDGCPAMEAPVMASEMMRCAAPSMPAPAAEPPEFNTAETKAAPENELTTPMDKPQAIFSANVNTASWSYIRSCVMTKRNIDRDFVRIEEIINSYKYSLREPEEDQLFSVNIEKGDCGWNKDAKLMFIGLKGKKTDRRVKQNLAFLVDVSGSMEDEWILTQMSMAAVASKLGEGDKLSIIAYSDNTVTVIRSMDCANKQDVVDAILSVDGIGGCTNGSEGLTNAYDYLQENFDKEANNRVFIFTDGDFNFGITSEGGLTEFIKKKRSTGIYLSIVGYGRHNFKDNKMEALAKNGNGNYSFVANPYDILDNLWEKLISNLVTIAKDVKISVELNPKYVKSYRLIGYDSRALTQKEFNDTEKAVDGIGSGHNVAAVIEYTPGEAKEEYSSRYVKKEAAQADDEFAFIEIHYKSPENENLVMTHTITKEELNSADSKNMAVASLLAAFGLLVKNSEYKGSVDKEYLKAAVSALGGDPSEEKPGSHFRIIRSYASK